MPISSLAGHPELVPVAQNCVWFKAPREALEYPEHFVAHVLTYGTFEDVKTLRGVLDDTTLRACIDAAPSGIFDKKSWAYWRLVLGMPDKSLPERACRFSG